MGFWVEIICPVLITVLSKAFGTRLHDHIEGSFQLPEIKDSFVIQQVLVTTQVGIFSKLT